MTLIQGNVLSFRGKINKLTPEAGDEDEVDEK
jgi:hypothetical protein